jgi:hypothetical protein
MRDDENTDYEFDCLQLRTSAVHSNIYSRVLRGYV